MYNIKINESEFGWTPLEMAGVSMKVLHKHEATGAMAVLTRMDAGAAIPAHFHTQADETVYVLAHIGRSVAAPSSRISVPNSTSRWSDPVQFANPGSCWFLRLCPACSVGSAVPPDRKSVV